VVVVLETVRVNFTSYRCLASHERAWQFTRGIAGFVNKEPLSDELIWGTAALRHASTWLNITCEGFAMSIVPKVGSNYWVVGRLRRDPVQANVQCPMATIDAFGPDWLRVSPNSDLYQYEAVLLCPGTAL
jgi:hypothetical protein